MSRIGQLRAGDSVEFREVTVDEAREELARKERAMRDRIAAIGLARNL
jgi:allophanate hydrolase subunit 2